MPQDEYQPFFAVFGSHSKPASERLARTSETHPLQIASVQPFKGAGLIGITFAPGKVDPNAATGAWDRCLRTDIEAIREWGASLVITLVEDHELDALKIRGIGDECLRLGIDWLHLPIQDVSTPDAAFEDRWGIVGEGVRSRLRNGFNVCVHCKGGQGRAGAIASRLLVELGAEPNDVISMVREVRPGAIETVNQEKHVLRQRVVPERTPSTTIDAIRDRALGALVGLAIGDAIGATLEFSQRDALPPLRDMIGGGPFNLEAGNWTDDTAMALCIADSLIACDGLNERDLLERFCRWMDHGENSATGTCFDIGITTRQALQRFQETADIHSGPTDPRTAGNGSLMRLAPVVLRFWNDPVRLSDAARRQSYTTHGATEAVDACEAFAVLASRAIQGKPLTDVLSRPEGHYAEGVQAILNGSWRGKRRENVKSSGYVLHSLEAAGWAFAASGNFPESVLKAANLGEDSDSVSAICGQLAGAYYGLSGIPDHWLERLAWRDHIEALGNRLFEGSQR